MNNFWTLVRFECKKILSRKITWIAFGLVFGVMMLFGFYRALVSHEVNGVRITAHEEEMQRKAKEKQIAGRMINDELLEEMFAARVAGTEAFAPYENIYRNIMGDLSDSITYGVIESALSVDEIKAAIGVAEEEELLYALRRQRVEKSFENQYLTEGEKEYWRDVLEDEKSVPWEYDYYQGVHFVWVAAYTAIVLIALMLAVCLSNLFADEHQKKTDQLVLCSRNGKKVLFGAKITAGLLFTMASTGLVLLATAVPQLIMFGADGWNAPIQLIVPTSMVQMTFGEMILYTYAVAVLASLLYCSIILCCSELFRNSTVAVMAVIVILVLVPMMIVVPYEYRVLSQIFDLNPINVIAIWSATDFRLVPFFGTYLTVHQVAPVIYAVLIAVFIWLGSRAYLKFQVSGR